MTALELNHSLVDVEIDLESPTDDTLLVLLESNRKLFDKLPDATPSIYLDQDTYYYSSDSVGVDLTNQLTNSPVDIVVDPKTFKQVNRIYNKGYKKGKDKYFKKAIQYLFKQMSYIK